MKKLYDRGHKLYGSSLIMDLMIPEAANILLCDIAAAEARVLAWSQENLLKENKVMSMFDTVLVKCPKCHSIIEFQSKAGSCELKDIQYYVCQ